MERKHFKPPQEINLLTWDAKEQIRFLHFEYPNEWTIDRLADSFPISQDGVIKLLKSSCILRSVKEVIRHDKSVQQHWKQILANSGSGLPQTILKNLPNAAGIKSLPVPADNTALNNKASSKLQNNEKFGLYESIARNHLQKTEAARKAVSKFDTKLLNAPRANVEESSKASLRQEQIDKIRKQNLKVLAGTKVFCQKLSDDNKSQLKSDYLKSFSSKENHKDMSAAASRPKSHRTLLDAVQNQMHLVDAIENGFQNDMKLPNTRTHDPGMVDTGKITEFTSETSNTENYEYLAENRQKYSIEAKTKAILEKIKYDQSKSNELTAYIYDEDTGYQYPLGSVSQDNEQILVPRDENCIANKMYRQGDCFYDETGKFLFKV